MFSLSFLYPLFLLGALAIAIPVILHLLKRDITPRVPFSDVRFLRRAPTEERRRKRLRELVLLALRVTALLLLAFAFARPYQDVGAGLDRPMTIVAVDASLSMSAPGRIERARDLAREAVRGTSGGAAIGVIAFDDEARVLVEPTPDRSQALRAIDTVTAGPGATRYGTVISSAVELIGAREGRISVVTDLQRSGWGSGPPPGVPARVELEVRDVGEPPANLAVTALERDAGEAMGVVLNTGGEPWTTRAVLRVDGQSRAETSVTARPGSTTVRFSTPLPAAGAASVTIDDETGFVFDNIRYALLDPPPPARVLLVTNDGGLERSAFFLERALAVADETSPFELRVTRPPNLSSSPSPQPSPPQRLRPARGRGPQRGSRAGVPDVQAPSASERGWGPASTEESRGEGGRRPGEGALLQQDYAAILLLGTEGLDRRGKEALAAFVRAGGGVLIVTGPPVDPALASGLFGDEPAVRFVAEPPEERVRSFEPSDLRHPIFRAFGELTGSLGQVRFRRTLRVAETPGARIIARFHDGTPALVEYAVGEGRALLFASDLNNDWNDFPRRPPFVPFVHETIRYLMGSRERPREFLIGSMPAHFPRQPGVVRASTGSARASTGSARPELVEGRPEPVDSGHPEPGRRMTSAQDRLVEGRREQGGDRVVINVDPRESDPGRLSVEEFRASVDVITGDISAAVEEDAARRESSQNYWWYVIAALVVVLIGESLLARRVA